jgi:hypothetical protein
VYECKDTRTITIKTGTGGVTATMLATGVSTNLVESRSALNTLVAPNPGNSWRLTDPDGGTLTGPTLLGPVTFSSMGTLVRG